MEEKFIKEDKKYTDCKELIHIKEEEKKPPCFLQSSTSFIKKEIKAEELDHECICAETSMKFTDNLIVKNGENNICRLHLSNNDTFYDKKSVDIRITGVVGLCGSFTRQIKYDLIFMYTLPFYLGHCH